jgi:UDP-galactose transporter B1
MLAFYYYHPTCLLYLIILGLMGALGQIVIFWMISLFRQHIVPFIVTTRKIVTTLLSILFFNHSSTIWQYVGIVVTLGIVVYDFKNEIAHQK